MKIIGLASDHAGFELKQYVKQWLEAKDGNIRTSVHTVPQAAIIQTSPTRWHWP